MGKLQVDEGWNAYWDEIPLKDNPYVKPEPKEAWADGWHCAHAEANKPIPIMKNAIYCVIGVVLVTAVHYMGWI